MIHNLIRNYCRLLDLSGTSIVCVSIWFPPLSPARDVDQEFLLYCGLIITRTESQINLPASQEMEEQIPIVNLKIGCRQQQQKICVACKFCIFVRSYNKADLSPIPISCNTAAFK